ncbi:MAG: DEAD/DEAH box helicase family protein, partial [Burkholderiaceae bacterium]|nr:DEAD/DEAH box helicase family protein [Burkholderiaceae bacterium]
MAVDTPQHTGLRAPLDYASEQALAPGSLVRVPLGRRDLTGVVWPAESGTFTQPNDRPVALRAVREVLSAVPPLSLTWCELVTFAAGYYQRSVGEVALAALPYELRKLGNAQLHTRIARLHKTLPSEHAHAHSLAHAAPPPPSPEQAHALASLSQLILNNAPPVVLLHGATGSGKTEVYLREAERVLAQGRQVLVLVPEINLTPQLESRFAERFSGGPARRHIVSLHSGLTPAQRLKNWLSAHMGLSDLVLGTRLAIFASLPRLGLIVVDEEHDPSYKQ